MITLEKPANAFPPRLGGGGGEDFWRVFWMSGGKGWKLFKVGKG